MSETPASRPATTATPSGANGVDRRLHDVAVPVTIVIGTKSVTLKELAGWQGDTLVSLDQGADEPIEVHVNGTRIATAELCEGEGGDGSLAIRILDVDTPAP